VVNVLSLFSGIGGLDLGLERAGMTVVGQVELDPFCQRVLAKHWPEVPRHEDVRTAVAWWTSQPRPAVDVVCGGFPCQDVSDAGRRAGIEGEQSGLWAHLAKVVRALRPRHVLVENAPGLLARGFGRVVSDLASLGYDAEWDCVPAAAVGAAHLRTRVWLLAYPSGLGDEAHDALQAGWPQPRLHAGWRAESGVGRVADGLPRGMAGRLLKPLGNAVVPQVAEHVGRLILDAAAGARVAGGAA
jgi:DNA (cytosine-5)-methyltransferase 1